MNVLTFDLEEWFHILDNKSTLSEPQWQNFEGRIEENLPRVLDLLSRAGQAATFFCLGWIGRKYPGLVKKIDALGHEIGTHSDMHQLVYTQTREEFRADLERSIKTLEDVTGKKVRAYRAPGFSVTEATPWAFDALAQQGIEIDCSVFTASRAHGGYGRFPYSGPCWIETAGGKIKEFPVTPFRWGPLRLVFSGGGYFRIMPYGIIRHLMKHSDYVMVYLHYRDFDHGQAVIRDLPLHRKFKSYVGTRGAFSKLRKLISDFDLVDLKTADTLVNWGRAPTVSEPLSV